MGRIQSVDDNALPPGVEQCVVNINASLSGHYINFPKMNILLAPSSGFSVSYHVDLLSKSQWRFSTVHVHTIPPS